MVVMGMIMNIRNVLELIEHVDVAVRPGKTGHKKRRGMRRARRGGDIVANRCAALRPGW